MSSDANKLFALASNLCELATDLLEKSAKKKEKLDPKAKVRNRGTVCVPASSAKDKKDHFPINSEAQARNALARVHQYSSVPSWYSGSLKSLQELVSRKVHSKYKGIGKDKKKKSSLEEINFMLTKYAQNGEMVLPPMNVEYPKIPTVNVEDLPKAPVNVESLPKANAPNQTISPEVQGALNKALGLNLKLDGKLSNETRAALQQFKTRYGNVIKLLSYV
jgi:hypothetical protein